MAERDFTEIARLSERYSKDPQSRIFVQLADAYRKNNMIEEAFDVLQKGLEHHPDYPLAHLIMGKCRFDKRMYAQAKESFRKTLEFDPQNVVALRMLAQTCEITNDEEGQITAYKGLLTIDPFDDQAREKLSQLEAKHKKEPLFTLAMAEEYEKQGNLDKALEIYNHLRSTDPSDLVVQQKIKTIENKITEEKKTIEAKKIESMQVETVFKPEQIEEKSQNVQKPQPETRPSPPAAAPPDMPKSVIKEDLMPLEDFLAESKEEPAVPPQAAPEAPPYSQAPGQDIIDEKLDLLEPFKPEEPADKVEKLDILEPVEADAPKEPVVEQPAPPPPVKTVQEKTPEPGPAPIQEPAPARPEPPPEKPAPVPEPPARPAAAEIPRPQTPPPSEAPKDEVIILQPPEETIPEPAQEEPATTPSESTVPPTATPSPVPEPHPAQAPPPSSTPTPQPTPTEPQPPSQETPAPAPEPRPAPAPEKIKEEPKPKPKEEDFQSFQDWLSGLIK